MASSPVAPVITRAPQLGGVRVAEATDRAAWDEYVGRHPQGTVDHLWAWRPVFENVLGHRTSYLVAERGGCLVGLLPLVRFRSRLFGRSLVSLPFLNYGGLLVDSEDVAAALVARAIADGRRDGASHVELRHVTRQCPDLPCRQHKLQMRRRLPTTVDELWASLDRKVRNLVRKGQKEGLTTVSGGIELVDEFYAVFTENMRDLGTPVYPRSLFSETVLALPEHTQVHVVRHGSEPVAAGFLLTYRGVALNPWASSRRGFRHLSPNMLLYWSMFESALALGATAFDFGRSSPGGGTHQFKLQWGAEETPMHWEYALLDRDALPDQGPTNPRFARAIEAWKRLPVSLATAIGPLISRHLP